MKSLILDIDRYLKLSREIEHPTWLQRLCAGFSYRVLPLVFLRTSQYFYKSNYLKLFSYLFYGLNLFIYRIEIPPRIPIGGGFFMPHPQNIVCGAASIGKFCTVYQGVTIGAKRLDFEFTRGLRPIIMNRVTLGSNSVIVGAVVIGAKSKIAPNSLVMCNIKDSEVVFGNRI
jgi:serine O-acetyltransferase